MRPAIYARMSTDKQNDRSPDDQAAECRRFAEARGWHVAEDLVACEAGISGASRHNRPKLLDLVARIAEWDVLLCWDSSRLARNSEDLGWIRNRLLSQRRTGYEVSTGLELSNVGAKVAGVFAEEYLVKLRADTQRGMRRRAEAGLSAGGLALGYRSEPVAVDAHGEAIESAGRRIVIDEAQAVTVRRIFDRYLAGSGLREIAHALNAEGVPSTRPRALAKLRASWAPSAIRAMLLNPIYAGERVFNRSEWIKDHETGKRQRFERPESEWIREDRPDLALINRATFDAAQAEMRLRAVPYLRSANRRGIAGILPGRGHRGPARYALSGFLECGVCGGGFHAQNGAERYACGWHHGRGPVVCESALAVPRTALEARIFGAIRERILVPEVVAYAVEKALAIVRDDLAPKPERRDAWRLTRLTEIDAEIDVMRRMAARPGMAGQLGPLIASLDAEREQLSSSAGSGVPLGLNVESLRPVIEARVIEMREAFAGAPETRRSAFRSLLGNRRMCVLPDADQRFRVEGLFELTLETADARGHAAPERLHSQVAGVGFEPTTSGL